MTAHDDLTYINHIAECIDKIQQYTENYTLNGFLENSMLQDAVIRQLEIMGEAANNLSSAFILKNNSINWKDIIGMRHKLIHDYFKVDTKLV